MGQPAVSDSPTLFFEGGILAKQAVYDRLEAIGLDKGTFARVVRAAYSAKLHAPLARFTVVAASDERAIAYGTILTLVIRPSAFGAECPDVWRSESQIVLRCVHVRYVSAQSAELHVRSMREGVWSE